MDTHFEGTVATELVQADGTATVVQLYFHLSSTHHRVGRIEDSAIDDLVSNSSFDTSTSGQVGGLKKPVLHLRITNERDLYFLYSIDVDDRTYREVKASNQLIVDFGTFHRILTELFRRCVAESSQPTPSFRCQLSLGGGLGSPTASDSHLRSPGAVSTARLSFLELSAFRQTHMLVLDLGRGTDEEVKRHLSGELRHYKTQASDLSARVRSLESELSSLQSDSSTTAETLREELRRATEAKERDVASVRIRLSEQLNLEKEEHVAAVRKLLQEKEAEKEAALEDARAGARRAQDERATLQRECDVLTDVRSKLRAENARLESQLEQVRVARTEDEGSLATLRKQKRELQTSSDDLQQRLQSALQEIAGFREQVAGQSAQLGQLNGLVESLQSQLRTSEEATDVYKAKSSRSEAKIKKAYSEIRRGSNIIEHLQRKGLKVKRRLKESQRAWKEADQLAKSRETELEAAARTSEDLRRKIAHLEDQEKARAAQLDEIRNARDLLAKKRADDAAMINSLSTQLNDVMTASHVPAGAGGLSSTHHLSNLAGDSALSSRTATGDYRERYSAALGLGIGRSDLGASLGGSSSFLATAMRRPAPGAPPTSSPFKYSAAHDLSTSEPLDADLLSADPLETIGDEGEASKQPERVARKPADHGRPVAQRSRVVFRGGNKQFD